MITPREALDQAEALLLDFDGPMAQLMPPPLNRQAAELVRCALGDDAPPELADSTDHIALLRSAPDGPARRQAEAVATEFEIACAETCKTAPRLQDLLAYTQCRGLPLAVVTNNSPRAVQAFLDRPDISATSRIICGRTKDTLDLMKPNPHYLREAIDELRPSQHRVIFIGDSVSDIQAGISAGVVTLGYARTEVRRVELTHAGAFLILTPNEDFRPQ
ncbi:MAG: HAD-IA family hydrolase [Dermatophilus congolensis]|nr:HAD-IA family hydrolase [Dermatophilus congolensis]